MFGEDFYLCEEFEPVEPWSSFEKKWFDTIRNALEEIKNGKRNFDSGNSPENS
jgi:hypothetical protein